LFFAGPVLDLFVLVPSTVTLSEEGLHELIVAIGDDRFMEAARRNSLRALGSRGTIEHPQRVLLAGEGIAEHERLEVGVGLRSVGDGLARTLVLERQTPNDHTSEYRKK